MRGRTLNHAFIILDEAQNTTPEQMKMFLTRIGFGAKAVVTGDVTQIDLPRGQKSGLVEARRILADVRGIAFTDFPAEDVVRHPLVQRIVDAYERQATRERERAAEASARRVQRAVRAARLPSRARAARAGRARRCARGAARSRCASSAPPKARALNRDFRGRDYATNVLTFAYDAGRARSRATSCCARRWCAREARAQGKTLAAHYAHLVVHGLLHLQGYDHERARARPQRMERAEIAHTARGSGIADPYAVEDDAAAPRLDAA